MLVDDTREFLRSRPWYAEAGIQHKRGYLLYGAPGTGKSSTIHALASELGLEIYCLSLATADLDDSGLSRLIASTPPNSVILIEDIDCAFPSREQAQKQKEAKDLGLVVAETKSTITLSGLLNVLDGVSSEEGRLLFATTNYVDRLDPALLRPGRMDVKIHYKLSTRYQIVNLFKRFYTISLPSSPPLASHNKESSKALVDLIDDEKQALATELKPSPTPLPDQSSTKDNGATELNIDNPIYPPVLPLEEVQRLAEVFADAIPQNEYSMAELQGYLLTVRTKPYAAVEGIKAWMVENEEEKARIARKKEEEEDEQTEKCSTEGGKAENMKVEKVKFNHHLHDRGLRGHGGYASRGRGRGGGTYSGTPPPANLWS